MLIAYLRDAIQEQLPPELVAGAEEQVVAIGTGNQGQAYRPDLQVRQPWDSGESSGVAVAARPSQVVATEPLNFFVDDEIDRWIEIRDENGILVTAVELLSHGNKQESAERDRYRSKRRTFISARVSLVEIDLVRQGASIFSDELRDALREKGATYAVCVSRATRPSNREVYPIKLRDRLPVIRVPLRATDADVTLDLQPLIDQCHERGRYHRLNYRLELDPPLPAADAAWIDEVLRGHGLR